MIFALKQMKRKLKIIIRCSYTKNNVRLVVISSIFISYLVRFCVCSAMQSTKLYIQNSIIFLATLSQQMFHSMQEYSYN